MKFKKIFVAFLLCAFLVCTLQTTFAQDTNISAVNDTSGGEIIVSDNSSGNGSVVGNGSDSVNKSGIRGVNGSNKTVTNSTVVILGDLKVDKPLVILGLLRDEFDNPLGNVLLNVDINGRKYSVTTNSEGYWSLSLNPPLSEGRKSLSVSWMGDDVYEGFVNKISYKVSKYDSKMSVSTRTIKEGQNAVIKVTLKDVNGKALSKKRIKVIVGGKTYTKATNSKGLVSFSVKGLKGGKRTVKVSFAGDGLFYGSSVSKVQSVKPRVDLAIVGVKALRSGNRQVATYRITIANKGSLKSRATRLVLWHARKFVKIKNMNVRVGSIGAGKKKSFVVSYYPDRDHHRFCIGEYFVLNPKKSMDEISYKNNRVVKTKRGLKRI